MEACGAQAGQAFNPPSNIVDYKILIFLEGSSSLEQV
jgi:hypothetical protein